MLQDAAAHLKDRLTRIDTLLQDEEVAALIEGNSSDMASWRTQLDELRQSISKPPETHIALIGSTGAGKSTLLNALLGKQILPVSSMKPCTAVITSVRHTSEEGYQASIQFLTREEWERELRVSTELLGTAVGDEERNDVDWNALKRVTQDKIRAVYGQGEQWADEGLSLQELHLPQELSRHMEQGAVPLVIREKDANAFRNRLRDYLSGDSVYWAVVKSVEISGPFDHLRGGAVLIDLPGVNDPNQAREDVTRKYLRDASYVWVIFNVKRGVTKDIRQLLIEQKMLRQFLLEGKADALTMVGTHADDISGVEGDEIEKLGLPEEAERIEIVLERNKRVKDQIRSDLHDIANDLGDAAGADADSLRRLRHTLQETHVYTASTRPYMKLQGIGVHHTDYGITDVDDTEVPQLLSHIESICHGRNHLEEVNQKTSLLLSEIENFFRARRTQQEAVGGELYEQLKKLHAQLETPRQNLQLELRQAGTRAEESFQAHQEVFEERLRIAVTNAQSSVEQVVQSWSGVHWATLRAIVLRNGEFVSPSNSKRYDFNVGLAEPLLKAIPFVWDDFFGHHLETSLAELKGQLHGRSDVFLEKLKSEARMAGAFDDAMLGIIVADIEVMRRNLEFQIREAIGRLKGTITRKRVELAGSITSTIGYKMKPSYEQAKSEQGTGMKGRILEVLRAHALRSSSEMFETIQQDLLEGIAELRLQFGDNLKSLNTYVGQQADNVLANLGGGNIEVESVRNEELIRKLDGVIAKVRS